jgi:DNA-binding transcriptional LysR family regulator
MPERDRWHGIEFRHLAALAAIARDHSFSRAADSLGYSQSAISQQISVLERIVGQELVTRPGGPQPVALTPAGAALVDHAEAIVARLAAARADLGALSDGATATLNVGCFQSAGARILAPTVRQFQPSAPDVRLTLREAADDGVLLDEVEQGELDLAFVVFPLRPGPFETAELLGDPYVLLVRRDSHLATLEQRVAVSALTGLPLIGYRDLRRVHLPEARLGSRIGEDNIVFRSDDDETIHALVAEGIGAAVIPWLSYSPNDERLTALPIAVPERIVGLAWHAERSLTPVARSFIEIARSVGAALRSDVEDRFGVLV